MFVYIVKINGSKTFKFIFALMIIFLICILGVVIFKVFNGAMNSENTSSCIPQNRVNKITANNYSNVLKAVHENIDDYDKTDKITHITIGLSDEKYNIDLYSSGTYENN